MRILSVPIYLGISSVHKKRQSFDAFVMYAQNRQPPPGDPLLRAQRQLPNSGGPSAWTHPMFRGNINANSVRGLHLVEAFYREPPLDEESNFVLKGVNLCQFTQPRDTYPIWTVHSETGPALLRMD